ncbi:MAG TPA: metallophosphoesterase [Vicinamibacterales bacterium]|nr:metallophosphoesterase [Vicinamibacterales bacterium]
MVDTKPARGTGAQGLMESGDRDTLRRPYRTWRKWWHAAERAVTIGRWPARLATQLGASSAVAVERQRIELDQPLGSARELRIAFASDFHAGPNTPDGLIDASIRELKNLKADLLLLGGDFVSVRPDYLRDLGHRLAQIPASLGRYAVLGNHDYWADGPAVSNALTDAGIHMLTNRNVALPAPFEHVSLCGLDDYSDGDPDADAAFAGARAVRIVLMHGPSTLLHVGERPFAVALCGHTHGGQIALPDGRPIKVALGPLSRRYNAGRYALDQGRVLLVSRGIGCSTIPLRFNAPPAILECTVTGGGNSVRTE